MKQFLFELFFPEKQRMIEVLSSQLDEVFAMQMELLEDYTKAQTEISRLEYENEDLTIKLELEIGYQDELRGEIDFLKQENDQLRIQKGDE